METRLAERVLPPLTGLRAFEAFARLGAMTAAARELRVTHGAVSRQIRGLEEACRFKLTHGPRNRLRLTEEGARLADALRTAFDEIESSLLELRSQAGEQAQPSQ